MIRFFLTVCFFSAPLIADENYWFDAEYLYWKIQDGKKTIPFVVEGPEVPQGASTFNQPGTEVVLGDRRVQSPWRSGARFTVGFWCNCICSTGVEANYFFLGKEGKKRSVFSDGSVNSPFLSVPYIDSNTLTEKSTTLALPGSFLGRADLKVWNQLQGAEFNAISNLEFCSCVDMDIFGGIRYINFSEKLSFNTDSPFINDVDNIYLTKESFHVDNHFYGGQFGMNLRFDCGYALWSIQAKLAVGAISQRSHIQGKLISNDFSGFQAVEYPGGYFAVPSVLGHHSRTQFSVVPEVSFDFAFKVCNGVLVFVGYDFLYIANTARASKQVERMINPTQSVVLQEDPNPIVSGPLIPKGSVASSNMWVHGINAGIEIHF